MTNIQKYASQCEEERLERQMQDDFLSYVEFDEDFDMMEMRLIMELS